MFIKTNPPIATHVCISQMSVENALEAIQVALKDLKRGSIGGDGGGDGGGGFNPVLNRSRSFTISSKKGIHLLCF